jgi:anti-anti-sigma factor
MFAFASFKALSQYSVDELLEMGVDGVWIGYEGTRSGYEKQKGRPPQDIIPELRRRGVTVLASMIVGFDYQDQAVVDAELRGLLRLRPHLSQFLIYAPMPGTPFYQRVLAEGRLRPEFVSNRPDFLRKCTGFASLVAHPKLGRPEIEALQERCFQRDYERLGPSIFRVIGAWMNGAVSLRGASSEILRKKSLGCAAAVRRTYPIFLAGRLFGPNPRIRRWIGAMERRAHRLFGAPTLLERAQSLVMLAMAAWTHLSLKIDWLQHPRPKPRRFRWDSGPGDLVRFFGERTPAGMASELRVFLEQKAAGMRLRLEGALDGKNGEQFRRRMEAALARGQQACVVNLEGLKSMDRKGLALFYKTFRRYRGRVRVVLPRRPAPDLMPLLRWFELSSTPAC